MKWTDFPAQWIQHHPFLAFLLACFVSIFSGDIRRFLKIQPQNLTVWILKTRIASVEERLNWLRKMYGNSNRLIAYFALKVFNAMVGMVAMLTIIFLELFELKTAVLNDFTKANHIVFFLIVILISATQITGAAGRAIHIYNFR